MLSANARPEEIYHLAVTTGLASAEELSAKSMVTASTFRRDLALLNDTLLELAECDGIEVDCLGGRWLRFPVVERVETPRRLLLHLATPLTGMETRMHAVLEYTYADDYLESREQYRADHLRAGWEAVERGELLLGGAAGEGPFKGLLIFTGENPLEAAKAFAEADPYVINGVVTSWTASPWTTVLGNEAASPVHP